MGVDPIFSRILITIDLIISLSLINFIGLRTSTCTNITFTLIEVSGLIFIIILGIPYIGEVNYLELPTNSSFGVVFSVVALIFFAYIGFEDIAKVAEESRDPHRNLPKAIIFLILITIILYCLVALSVVSVAPYESIADSETRLRFVATVAIGPIGGITMTLVALFASANTVLIILIVNSRTIYGMARDKALPQGLKKFSPKHKTPTFCVLLTMIFTNIPVFFLDISIVANATVFGVLINFFLVNISLIALRRNQPDKKRPF